MQMKWSPTYCKLLGSLLAVFFGLGLAITFAYGAMATPQPAPEGNLLVTTLEDELNTDGDCSLREAVEAANTNAAVDACPAGDAVISDTITFEVVGTITVTSQLSVTAGGPLVVDGGGVITTSGGRMTRVWWVEIGGELTLQRLGLIDGVVNRGNGGGLYNNGGRLTIIDCTFSNNISANTDEGGGGIYNGGTLTIINSTLTGNNAYYDQGGGGIFNTGIMTLTNSILSENYAYLSGGAIYNMGIAIVTNSNLSLNYGYYGGAVTNGGSLTVTNSSFSGNDALSGGGIMSGGTMSVINSTISENNAFEGGAICIVGGVVTVINSTLSGNSVDNDGGAIYNRCGGVVMVINSTLSGNSAEGAGGAICNLDGGGVTVANSIVANSPMGGDCINYDGFITDGGHNISSDNSCGFYPANGSMPNTDPLLGSLQNNGGPTWTHALLWDSPAIDAGDNAQCPETDQRGMPRPQDGDNDGLAVCDIGAYEREYETVSPTRAAIIGLSEGVVGQSYIFTSTVEPVSTTLPLTYAWQVDGQTPITHTSGLSDTSAYTWAAAGVYTLTVQTANVWGTVSDTHSITITDAPIEGLAASNDSPTLLGEATTLSATVSAGTNVVFIWDFGDGEFGSGPVVTHTYSSMGIFTATVTATNSTNSMTASTLVTITVSAPTYWQYLPFTVKGEDQAQGPG